MYFMWFKQTALEKDRPSLQASIPAILTPGCEGRTTWKRSGAKAALENTVGNLSHGFPAQLVE